jgi:hypothetical protein
MAHVDDSGDELGQHFRDEEEAYLWQCANWRGSARPRPERARSLPGPALERAME